MNGRRQLTGIELPGQVIIGAESAPEDFVTIFVPSGELQDRGQLLRRTQTVADFESIQFGSMTPTTSAGSWPVTLSSALSPSFADSI